MDAQPDRWTTVVAILLLAAAGAVGWMAWRLIAEESRPASSADSIASAISVPDARPPTSPLPENAWSVIVPGGDVVVRQPHDRYRLAGTFFLMGGSESGQRLAIIDDITGNRQHIVSEGQAFEGHEILRIFPERLVMRRDGIEIELSLSFRDGVAVAAAPSPTNQTEAVEEQVLETSRFGKRIGESRWVMQKEALVGYYQELLEDPERIASIYMSMKPDYDPEGQVAGYRVEKEGEAEFFEAVGLREGDTIRKVNSMNMTSQARAEYFISEFMKERLGAVVLDVERNGQQEKLIYLFR